MPSNIERRLRSLRPEPSGDFHRRMSTAPWAASPHPQKGLLMNARTRFATATLTILLALAALLALTPQGRAFAQGVLRFFVRAGSEVRQVPALVPTIADVPADHSLPTLPPQPEAASLPFRDPCGDVISPLCSPQQIRAMVAFPIRELAYLPDGWDLVGATGGPELVYVIYRSPAGALELSQGPNTFPQQFTWPVGGTANVETVSIGTSTGEYVQGMWSDSGQNAGSVTWDAGIPQRTLRWEAAGIRYTLRFLPAKSDEGIEPDKAMLADLAARLTTESPFDSSPRPTPVTDIATVAAQAGFPVTGPGWLPERFALVDAAYIPAQGTVCLYYSHPGSERFTNLVIIESMRTLSLQDILMPPQFQDGIRLDIPVDTQTVAVGGAQDGQALYASNGLDVNPLCGSRDLVSNHVLLWQADGKSFIISATLDAYDGRSFLTPMEMRRVAEGLTGLATIPADDLDPEFLPSAAAAETLAGFDVKAPTRMPAEMRFAYATYRDAGSPASLLSMSNGGPEVVLAYFAPTSDSLGRRHAYLFFENTVPTNTLEEMAMGGGEWVTVGGLPAVYSQVCWDETAGGGDAACNIILSWLDENGVRFDIFAYLPGALEKETLIDIAESMR
jgi:hypothetical protein